MARINLFGALQTGAIPTASRASTADIIAGTGDLYVAPAEVKTVIQQLRDLDKFLGDFADTASRPTDKDDGQGGRTALATGDCASIAGASIHRWNGAGWDEPAAVAGAAEIAVEEAARKAGDNLLDARIVTLETDKPVQDAAIADKADQAGLDAEIASTDAEQTAQDLRLDALDLHPADTAIHTTQARKDANDAHIADLIVHTTQARKDANDAHIADAASHVSAADRTKWDSESSSTWTAATRTLVITHEDGAVTTAAIAAANILDPATPPVYDDVANTVTFTWTDTTTSTIDLTDLFDSGAFNQVVQDDALFTLTFTDLAGNTTVRDLSAWLPVASDDKPLATNVTAQITGAEGVSPTFSRSDHIHPESLVTDTYKTGEEGAINRARFIQVPVGTAALRSSPEVIDGAWWSVSPNRDPAVDISTAALFSGAINNNRIRVLGPLPADKPYLYRGDTVAILTGLMNGYYTDELDRPEPVASVDLLGKDYWVAEIQDVVANAATTTAGYKVMGRICEDRGGGPAWYDIEANDSVSKSWVYSTNNMNAVDGDKIIVQPNHNINFPGVVDLESVQLAPATGNWSDIAAGTGGFTPDAAWTFGLNQNLLFGSDVITAIANLGSTNWLLLSGGEDAPSQDQRFETVALLPPPGTVNPGAVAVVYGDPTPAFNKPYTARTDGVTQTLAVAWS